MRDCERQKGWREQCSADHRATSNVGWSEARAGWLEATGGVLTGEQNLISAFILAKIILFNFICKINTMD